MKKKTVLVVIGVLSFIGLLFTACGNGANGDTFVPEGKWTFTDTNMSGTYSYELTFSGNTYKSEVLKTLPDPGYMEGYKGTFLYNTTTITFNQTHKSSNGIDWIPLSDTYTINYSCSGENLTFDYGDGDEETYTKVD